MAVHVAVVTVVSTFELPIMKEAVHLNERLAVPMHRRQLFHASV